MFNKAVVKDVDDPLFQHLSQSSSYIDVHAGIDIYYREIGHFGVTAFQLPQFSVNYNVPGGKKLLEALRRHLLVYAIGGVTLATGGWFGNLNLNYSGLVRWVPISKGIINSAPAHWDLTLSLEATNYGWVMVSFHWTNGFIAGIGVIINNRLRAGAAINAYNLNLPENLVGRSMEFFITYEVMMKGGKESAQFY